MRAEEEAHRRDEAQRKADVAKAYAEERKRLEQKLHETHLSAATAKPHMIKSQSVDSSQAAPQKKSLIAGRTQMFEAKVAELAATKPPPLKRPKDFKYKVGVIDAKDAASRVPVNRQGERDSSWKIEIKADRLDRLIGCPIVWVLHRKFSHFEPCNCLTSCN